MTNPIRKKLEEARLKLLDLTMRNRLLNFKPPKRKAIKVVDEDPSEIYDMLVLNEETIEFLPKEKKPWRMVAMSGQVVTCPPTRHHLNPR